MKKIDIEITREEAENYLDTMSELEFSPAETEEVAGGRARRRGGEGDRDNDYC